MKKPHTPKIENGTEVAWSSSSAGSTTTKTGIVVAFIPSWTTPFQSAPCDVRNIDLTQCIDRTGGGWHRHSQNPRYLVKLKRKPGLKDVYYSPRATTIEKQNPNAHTESTAQ